MNKAELNQKLVEIELRLQNLGDISSLVQDFIEKKANQESLIASLQAQKSNIDEIPTKKAELEKLLIDVGKLEDVMNEHLQTNKERQKSLGELEVQIDKVNKLSLEQLGVISNEKLSNSFDKVKDQLKTEKESWFKWLFGTTIILCIAIIAIVWWQTSKGDTLFEISFLVKIALTSPLVFFEYFLSDQYHRAQRLIEEYEFKASIARSLEAYKEIIENLFADHEGDDYKKKLDFLLDSIGQLYSSPMKNIKDNESKEIKTDKKMSSVLTDIKGIISDVKDISSK